MCPTEKKFHEEKDLGLKVAFKNDDKLSSSVVSPKTLKNRPKCYILADLFDMHRLNDVFQKGLLERPECKALSDAGLCMSQGVHRHAGMIDCVHRAPFVAMQVHQIMHANTPWP